MKSIRAVVAALSGALILTALVATGCGGGECGEGTVEQDGECVLVDDLEQCDDGEALSGGECVPYEQLCDPGTEYDEELGRCVSAEDSCGVNTSFEDGECVAEDPVECTGDTELAADENRCYPTAEVCGEGTAFSGDEQKCLPVSEVCRDDTYFDEDSHLCYPAIGCQPGDVLVDGVCLRESEAKVEDADVVAGDDTNPEFGGDPEPIELADIGEEMVFTGVIGEPQQQDGEYVQQVDYFEFDAEAGDWIEVSVESVGLPNPALKIEKAGDDSVEFERFTAEGVADKTRSFIAPADGTYHLSVHPGAALDRQIGGDDWGYVGTVGLVEQETADSHDFDEQNFEGTLGDPADNQLVVDQFEEGDELRLHQLESPDGADVIQVWASPGEFVEQIDFGADATAEFEIPDTDELVFVFDWTTKFGSFGHGYEIAGEPIITLASGETLEVEFSAEDGDDVRVEWQREQFGGTVAITIRDDDGEVVAEDESVSQSGDLTEIGLEEGDYTVEFENDGDSDHEDFQYDIHVESPTELEAFDVDSDQEGDVVEISHDFDDPVELFVYDDADQLVESATLDADDHALAVVGVEEGDYTVRPDSFDGPDEDDGEVTVEFVEPQQVTDFDDQYTGTANEHQFGEHDYYEVELDETRTHEITIQNDGGAGWGRFFIYGWGHEQLERLDSTVSFFGATGSLEYEFEENTPRIIRVGSDESFYSADFDYTLTFDPQPIYTGPDDIDQVVLSELMKSPTELSADEGQWIELHNATGGDTFDLYGCTVSTAGGGDVTIDSVLEVDGGEFVTIANSDDPGFEPDYVIEQLSLDEDDGEVTILCDGEVVSSVMYDAGDTYPHTDGVSLVRDPDSYGDDVIDEPWLWCQGSGTYNGSDVGSPGQMPDDCPWMDEDAAGDIEDIFADVDDAGDEVEYDDLTLEGVLVTYARPDIGNDPAGFFVQATEDGPALFVPDDNAEDLDDLPVRRGEVVDLEVEAVDEDFNTGIYVSDVGDIDVVRLYVPPSTLTVDVSDDDELVDELDDNFARLISAEMTVESDPGFAGSGYNSFDVSTDGIPDGDDLELRIPFQEVDRLGAGPDCELRIEDTPLWRFGDTAQLSFWELIEVVELDCPDDTQPVDAHAVDPTTVQVDFNRALGGVAEDGSDFTIDGLDVDSASYEDATVMLETSEQDSEQPYTVEVEDGLEDFWGNEVTGEADFEGFETLEVAISEFMARYHHGQYGTGIGEFIELYNPGEGSFDLDGCVLDRPNIQAELEIEDVVIGEGEEVVFTRTEGGDADLDEADTLPYAVVNSGTTVELRCDGEVIDAITYTTSHVELGVSYQKDADQLGMPNPDGGIADDIWCFTPQTDEFEYTVGSEDGEPKYGTPDEGNTTCE